MGAGRDQRGERGKGGMKRSEREGNNGWKEKKGGEGGEEGEGAAGEEARRARTGRSLCSRAAFGELSGLFQASGLWLQALDHRGQCEAGLFGDVFSAGPVCLFSVFLAADMSVVKKREEVRGVAGIDNGPQAG